MPRRHRLDEIEGLSGANLTDDDSIRAHPQRRVEQVADRDDATTPRVTGPRLELYDVLRAGRTDDACDLVCASLASGKAGAAAIWDAIQLVAADLICRYKTGGTPIGGALIHAVTATNALRFAFECARSFIVSSVRIWRTASTMVGSKASAAIAATSGHRFGGGGGGAASIGSGAGGGAAAGFISVPMRRAKASRLASTKRRISALCSFRSGAVEARTAASISPRTIACVGVRTAFASGVA